MERYLIKCCDKGYNAINMEVYRGKITFYLELDDGVYSVSEEIVYCPFCGRKAEAVE